MTGVKHKEKKNNPETKILAMGRSTWHMDIHIILKKQTEILLGWKATEWKGGEEEQGASA